jgi:hypothetical protein
VVQASTFAVRVLQINAMAMLPCGVYGTGVMADNKLDLWERFCQEHRVFETGVPLFASDAAGRVISTSFGKDARLILRRSDEMEALVLREVDRVLSDAESRSEGLLYMMHWRDDTGRILPLYIGRAGKHGKGGGNISANLLGIAKDTSKFARWGTGYAYHIGDLSAAACPGHHPDRIVNKYRRWADRLFSDAPALTPALRRPVYFWATAWGPGSYNIWHDFGPCFLSFEEYLLIGVASELFPDILLNAEGVNRPAFTEKLVPLDFEQ